ncbi:MAG: hypothetical protein AB7L17_16900 [Ilumatobacteraceae bacterium]
MELVDYIDAIRAARRRLSGQDVASGSTAAYDREVAKNHTGSYLPMDRVLGLADLWTLIAADHLQSIATLVRSGTYAFGLFPLGRSVIEHSTATRWILDPNVTGYTRCARAALAVDRSMEQAVGVASKIAGKSSEGYRTKRAILRQHRATVAAEFPEGTDLQASPKTVGNEALLGPTELVEHYAVQTGDDPRESIGVYSWFCCVANHPTAAAYEMYDDVATVGFRPGHTPEFMRRVMPSIVAPCISAVQAHALYCGWDCDEIEGVAAKWSEVFRPMD